MPRQYLYKHIISGEYYQYDVEQFHPNLKAVNATYYKGNLLFGTPWLYELALGWYVVYRVENEDAYFVAIRGGYSMEVLARCTLLRTALRICTNINKAFPNATVAERRLIVHWLGLAHENRTRGKYTKEYSAFLKKHNLKSPFRSMGKGSIKEEIT